MQGYGSNFPKRKEKRNHCCSQSLNGSAPSTIPISRVSSSYLSSSSFQVGLISLSVFLLILLILLQHQRYQLICVFILASLSIWIYELILQMLYLWIISSFFFFFFLLFSWNIELLILNSSLPWLQYLVKASILSMETNSSLKEYPMLHSKEQLLSSESWL